MLIGKAGKIERGGENQMVFALEDPGSQIERKPHWEVPSSTGAKPKRTKGRSLGQKLAVAEALYCGIWQRSWRDALGSDSVLAPNEPKNPNRNRGCACRTWY